MAHCVLCGAAYLSEWPVVCTRSGCPQAGASRGRSKIHSLVNLGALELTADEVAQFEKWTTETTKPTKSMVEAAKLHKALRHG